MGNLTKNTITRGAVVALALSAGAATTANAAVTRTAGADRYATATQIFNSWPTTPDTAILAAGMGHDVDALTVAPLAKMKNAPIILVDSKDSAATIAAKFAQFKTVYIANGTGVISPDVEAALKTAGVTTVTRLGGTTRTDTALKIAKEIGAANGIVVANGDNSHLVDTLSIASIAAAKGMPIFLTGADGTLDAAQITYAKGLAATTVYAIGGTTLVTDATVSGLGTLSRLAGAGRYETNAKVVTQFKADLDLSTVYVASGEDANLIDALAGAPLAGLKKAPIVFAHDSVSTDVNTLLNSVVTPTTAITILGGTGAVTPAVETSITAIQTAKGSATLSVASVSAINLNQIKVTFNQAVDKTSAETISNYTLDNGNGLSAALDNAGWTGTPSISLQADGMSVVITLDTVVGGANAKLSNQIAATLAVANVYATDKVRVVGTNSTKFTFVDVAAPTAVSVTSLGNRILQVKFSEDVVGADSVYAYKLDGNSLSTYGVSSLTYDRASNKATISFINALPTTTKTLTVSQDNSIVDLSGLKLLSQDLPVTVGQNTAAATISSVNVASDKSYIDVVFSKPIAFATDFGGVPLKIDGLSVYGDSNIGLSISNGNLRLTKVNPGSYDNFVTGGSHSVNVISDSDNYITDAFGVNVNASSVTYNLSADSVAPTVVSVTNPADKEIDVKFSEAVDTTTALSQFNYSITDVNGNAVAIASAPVLKSGTTDTVKITTTSSVAAGVTKVTVAAVQDKSSNVMTTYSGTFTAVDRVAPTVTAINTNDVHHVYVVYSKSINITSATTAANYKYNGDNLPAGTTLSMVGSNVVDITFPITTTLDHANDQLSVSANVSDTIGNTLAGFGYTSPAHSWNLVTANNVGIVAGSVKLVSTKKVEVKLDKELKSINLGDFKIDLGGGAVALNSAAGLTAAITGLTTPTVTYTNSSGQATVTFTFNKDIATTDGFGLATGNASIGLGLTAVKSSVAVDGSTFAAGAVNSVSAEDDVVPVLISNSATTGYAIQAIDVDGDSKVDHIIVTFSEAMDNTYFSKSSFSVTNYTLNSVATDSAVNWTGLLTDLGSTPTGDGASGKYVVLAVTEKASADLTSTPAVTFNGTMKDANGNTFVLPTSAKITNSGAAAASGTPIN